MAVSVATLIDQSKLAADKRGDASIPDVDWLIFVNWAVESLWRVLTSLDPGLYFGQGDFTLTGNAAGAVKDLSTVTGLTGFRSLHGLDLNPDTTNRRTVTRRGFRERNLAQVATWIPALLATDRRYDLRARTLVITPYEAAGGNYRAYAKLAPYLFVSTVDATALDWQLEQYHEWIVLVSARRGLGYEESDGGPHSERLAELRQEINDAHERDSTEPSVIADVEEDRWWP